VRGRDRVGAKEGMTEFGWGVAKFGRLKKSELGLRNIRTWEHRNIKSLKIKSLNRDYAD
jgi:hypothetical protein